MILSMAGTKLYCSVAEATNGTGVRNKRDWEQQTFPQKSRGESLKDKASW